MAEEVGESIDGDRQRAGADGDMGIANPGHIEEQRHRKNRAAAADQAQRKAYGDSGQYGQNRLCKDQLAGAGFAAGASWIGLNGPSRCCSSGNVSAKGGNGASTGLRARLG